MVQPPSVFLVGPQQQHQLPYAQTQTNSSLWSETLDRSVIPEEIDANLEDLDDVSSQRFVKI